MKRERTCILCDKPLNWGRKFCSRDCKSQSQKKLIDLICPRCSKKFVVHPYLKRPTNYCSRECYWFSTRKKYERRCRVCGKSFLVKAYLVEQGFGIFCSRKCRNKTYPKRLEKSCLKCGKKISIQPARSDLTKYCSKKCSDDSKRDYVERICKNCNKKFELPRWELNKGKGIFCRRECYIQYNGESSIEKKMRFALKRAGIDFRQEVKIGIYRADFLLTKSNIILECDGDFWHSRPWSGERDLRKDNHLIGKGYKVIRVPEKTIRNLSLTELINEVYTQI